MPLETGTTLGSYEILGSLGTGGMGEVYRAKDSKLGREVAIKVLPEAVAHDPERLLRFEREARALAALNHPNIATIHGFETASQSPSGHVADGPVPAAGASPIPFLVMELVEGETLADRLRRGALPYEEAIPLFVQVADGLEAAHDKGIVHRDLKPANIKVFETTSGGPPRIKILDFGLAKALAPDQPAADKVSFTESPTLTLAATMRGEILGTAAYMAPEQAKGEAIDRRADVWAFGVCLFEVLTGRRSFEGQSAPEILAKVLEREPDFDLLPDSTPRALRRLLERCLKKPLGERLRDIGDARLELEAALEAGSEPASAAAPAAEGPRRSLSLGLGVLTVLSLFVTGWALLRAPADVPGPTTRFVIDLPEERELVLGPSVSLAVSPDGMTLVYVGREGDQQALFRRRMDELDAAMILGTEGAQNPTFSPDGEWVAFFSGAKLMKSSLRGGSPIAVCDWPSVPAGMSWGTQDTIAIGGSLAPLSKVSAGGGTPQVLTELDADSGEAGHGSPFFLPGERALLLAVSEARGTSRVDLVTLPEGERRPLLEGKAPRYVESGHLIFSRGQSLWAVPFDLDALELEGDAVPILEGVQASLPFLSESQYLITSRGSLLYVQSRATDAGFMVAVDRTGVETRLFETPDSYRRPRRSPDGRRILLENQGENAPLPLVVFDLENGTRTPQAGGFDAVWNHEGDGLFHDAGNNIGFTELGGGAMELLLERSHNQSTHSASPDGRFLAYYEIHPTSRRDLWVLPLEGDPTPQPVLVTAANERSGSFSPDSRWLAYVSDQTGRDEVYVMAFPGGEGRRLISTNGGTEPVWSPRGDELFYRDGDRMMAVPVQLGETLETGTPVQLFEQRYDREPPPSGSQSYDVALDGQTFYMIDNSQGRHARIVVVENWLDELERLVPTD